jgi:hypothetical protein
MYSLDQISLGDCPKSIAGAFNISQLLNKLREFLRSPSSFVHFPKNLGPNAQEHTWPGGGGSPRPGVPSAHCGTCLGFDLATLCALGPAARVPRMRAVLISKTSREKLHVPPSACCCRTRTPGARHFSEDIIIDATCKGFPCTLRPVPPSSHPLPTLPRAVTPHRYVLTQHCKRTSAV